MPVFRTFYWGPEYSGITSDRSITDVSDGAGDDLNQLGDISGETFGSQYGGPPYNYLGTAGAGFVAERLTYQYYFTNNPAFQGGDPFPTFDPDGVFNIACYVTGTLIRTVSGEVAVEQLSIGDRVITASGGERAIRWIGRRSYDGKFANTHPGVLPIGFKAGSLADNVPARDLWVSPRHAIFIDGVLIAAEQLVNGVSIVQAERVDAISYWHVELDSHDVLLAEGAPSESFVDDDSRAMFHNAAEFAAAYPDAPKTEAVYCAPRVRDGQTLHDARARLARRAGLEVAPTADFGSLTGEVAVRDGRLTGWARNGSDPQAPVCLDIVADGVLVGRVLARTETERGQAFDSPLPDAARLAFAVELRRSADGARLGEVRDGSTGRAAA